MLLIKGHRNDTLWFKIIGTAAVKCCCGTSEVTAEITGSIVHDDFERSFDFVINYEFS